MEINIPRQIEYNNYNIGVLEALNDLHLITPQEFEQARLALRKLQKTLNGIPSIATKYYKVVGKNTAK